MEYGTVTVRDVSHLHECYVIFEIVSISLPCSQYFYHQKFVSVLVAVTSWKILCFGLLINLLFLLYYDNVFIKTTLLTFLACGFSLHLRFIDKACEEAVPVAILAAYSINGEKVARLVVYMLSLLKIFGL